MSYGEQSNNPQDEVDLLSLEIKIGDALQLQDLDINQQRYFVRLIGYLNHQTVLVSYPERDEQLLDVFVGQNFLVRGFADRKTYEFNTHITDICLNTVPYLMLAFPENLNVITLRGALRIRQSMSCSIQYPNSPLKLATMIDDISTSGARLVAKVALGEVGDQFELYFSVPLDGQELSYSVPVVVRNTPTDTENSQGEKIVSTGVQFLEMTGKERILLQNYICKCLVEGKE